MKYYCRAALRPNGLIVIKENCTNSEEVEHDSSDSSATRPFKIFTTLFTDAGFKVLKYVKQKNFPTDLYPVWTFAIKPKI